MARPRLNAFFGITLALSIFAFALVEPASAQLGCVPADCNDGIACTTDVCNILTGECTHLPLDLTCSDNQFCNGTETCNTTVGCVPGAPPNCSDGIACTLDTCNEALDLCAHAVSDAVCDNGLYCDGGETCNLILGCLPGVPVVCTDLATCTTDACNETTDQCDHVPDDGACSDGLFCDGEETCDPVLGCQLGTLEACDDAIACTLDLCNELTDTCDHTPTDLLCDDGAFCSGTETCNATTGCEVGESPCFPQGCNELVDICVACTTNADCDDTIFCNGTETCNELLGCLPGLPVLCTGGDACSVALCDETADACVEENLCCGDSLPNAGEECDPPNAEDCNNGVDDDGDGRRDCVDLADCTDGGTPLQGVETCGDTCAFDLPCARMLPVVAFIKLSPGFDRLRIRGRFLATSPVDAFEDGLTVSLANELGTIYDGALLPYDLKVRGRGYLFKDRAARFDGVGSRGGIGSARVRELTSDDAPLLRVGITIYGDFEAATTALMTHQVAVGDDGAFAHAPWTVKSNGWKLRLKR